MLRPVFYQLSLEEVDPAEIGLENHAFERALRDLLPTILPLTEFRGWRSEQAGTNSCCPLQLSAMMLLAGRYDLSDNELMRRCQRDLGFRYALGLTRGQSAPSLSSYKRFRRWVRAHRGPDWLCARILAGAVARGQLTDSALAVVDSTGLDCAGARMDTLTLISRGIGHALRTLARSMGYRAQELAHKWQMSVYLQRSIKGQQDIDWSSEAQRTELLGGVLRDALRLPGLVRKLRRKRTEADKEALALLRRVALQDVEKGPDGRYRIRQGVAPDRIISIHDEQARHGRKSRSQLLYGYKTHVLCTVASRFVVGWAASSANVLDGEVLPELLDQAQSHQLLPERTLGDQAYGQGAVVRACAQRGVEVCSKVSGSAEGKLTKRDFDIDLQQMEVRCPQGHRATRKSQVKAGPGSNERVWKFHVDKSRCQGCPLASRCGQNVTKEGRDIKLDVHEAELQALKQFYAQPQNRQLLRQRSIVEAILSQLVRMGLRQARYRGIEGVRFQVGLTVAAYNLQRLMTLLANRE
jgi:IS5 family transposase